MGSSLGAAVARRHVGGAAGERDDAVGQGLGPVELVGGQEHRGPRGHRPADEAVEEVAAFLVEAGVGLVEQPQLGAAGQEAGQRRAAALPGRQAGHDQVGQPAVEPAAVRARASMSACAAPAARPQKRTLSTTVSSSYRPVAWPSRPTRRRTRAGLPSVDEVVTEHLRLAPRDREQPRAQAQQRGLPGPVRAAEEHDLTGGDVEVDPGQGGEPAQEGHRAAEVDDGFHGVGQGY